MTRPRTKVHVRCIGIKIRWTIPSILPSLCIVEIDFALFCLRLNPSFLFSRDIGNGCRSLNLHVTVTTKIQGSTAQCACLRAYDIAFGDIHIACLAFDEASSCRIRHRRNLPLAHGTECDPGGCDPERTTRRKKVSCILSAARHAHYSKRRRVTHYLRPSPVS